MLDQHARHLVEDSILPMQLTGEAARDLLSISFMQWLAEEVFEATVDAALTDAPERLSRLSLASSLLASTGHLNATAFLIAEASDVARAFDKVDSEPPLVQFRRAVRCLDVAGFFHLADYDANAYVVAGDALALLDSVAPQRVGVTTAAHLSYYRSLALFLLRRFRSCRDEALRPVPAGSTEERAFLFLRSCLADLTSLYGQGDPLDHVTQQRIARLQQVLRDRDHPYFSLSAEVRRVLSFIAAAERKSLYELLRGPLSQEPAYLRARVSSDDDNGFPFAWPPAQVFSEEYLSGKSHHAVVTIPTGGGKSFLAELAVVQALRSGWVLYLAPTNALCAQVRDDLTRNLETVSGHTVEAYLGRSEYTAELPRFQAAHQVLAITPEKALLLLKREPERYKRCSLIVLDECQILGSSSRGAIAEIVLAFAMAQNRDVRVVLMSALVSNGHKLASWLQETTGRPSVHISKEWRPTRAVRSVVLPDWEALSASASVEGQGEPPEIGVRIYADTVTPWEEGTALETWSVPSIRIRQTNGRFPWRNQVSRQLAELFARRGIPILVFVLHNRHHAFSIASDFRAPVPNRPPATQREQDLLEIARYELGTDSLLRMLINENAAAVHTAIMLDCEREVSELAFEHGRALLLTATGTLSQGLNLVAKGVILCGTHLSEYGEANLSSEELKHLSLNQALNALGRAARANIACRGISIVVPDTLIPEEEGLTEKSPKSRFIERVPVLAERDAALPVDSSTAHILEQVSLEQAGAETGDDERVFLSRLPIDPNTMSNVVRNLLGVSELRRGDLAATVIDRLQSVVSRAVQSGYAEWMLRAASLSGLSFDLAGNLKRYIDSRSGAASFVPPEDTYLGWTSFLIGWLRSLPALNTREMLVSHIKAWRYYWGGDRDPDLIELLESERYPRKTTDRTTTSLQPIWENLEEAVSAWLQGKNLLEIACVLTRRSCPRDREMKRTSAGNYIPRAIIWSRAVVDELSRFAGLLLALQNQWVEHAPGSAPDWLTSTVALHTLPLGIRYGVKDPFALCWHRYVIQERCSANLLQSIAPLAVDEITDLREARPSAASARSAFTRTDSDPSEPKVVSALRRVVASR